MVRGPNDPVIRLRTRRRSPRVATRSDVRHLLTSHKHSWSLAAGGWMMADAEANNLMIR